MVRPSTKFRPRKYINTNVHELNDNTGVNHGFGSHSEPSFKPEKSQIGIETPIFSAVSHVSSTQQPFLPLNFEESIKKNEEATGKIELHINDDDENVTISREALRAWQHKVVLEIEEYYSDEQLKRIAEFGRVHAQYIIEAREYVSQMEVHLKKQLEQQREALLVEAEAHFSSIRQENERLKMQNEDLSNRLTRKNEEPHRIPQSATVHHFN